jgi:hypothetical protein
MDKGCQSMISPLQNFRTGIKEPFFKTLSPLLLSSQVSFFTGAVSCAFQSSMPKHEGESRKYNFLPSLNEGHGRNFWQKLLLS